MGGGRLLLMGESLWPPHFKSLVESLVSSPNWKNVSRSCYQAFSGSGSGGRSLIHSTNVKKRTLPEQFRPFPVKPGSHLQLKCPAVFTQVAFWWQSWLPLLHSSISK